MSRNSRNGESAKNRISQFSPNSPFSSKLPFPRAPLPSHLPRKLYFGEFLPYSPYFRQIGHYRQNRYFGRRPFAISFDLFILLWRFFAIFKVFAKFAIFDKIANLKGDPWSFLISLVPKALAEFRPIRQFSSWTRLSNFSYRRRLDQLIQLYIRLSYTGLLKTATVLFVFYPKCQSLLKPRARAKSFSQKLTPFPGKGLHLALFRNKTWVHWSLQEWPISFM